MALGEDAVRRGARPWQIRFDRPGDGYLWDSEANSVRYLHVPFVTDEEIHMLRKEDGEAEAGQARRRTGTATLWGSHRGLLRRPLLRCEMRDEDE